MSEEFKKALKNLREHQAPDSIWDKLEANLNQEVSESPLKEALKQLPVYEPSDKVWETIVGELPRPKSFMQVYRRSLSIAASAAILIGCGVFFFMNPADQDDYKYAYSEEVLDERIQLENIEDDEEAFAMIAEICTDREFLCKHVDFQRLRGDFEELNSAYEELQFAISEFNTSPELMDEMTNIEMERTVVFKQLLAML